MQENIAIGILLLVVFVGSALFYRCLMACCTLLAYREAGVIWVRKEAKRQADMEMQSTAAEAGGDDAAA